MQDIVGFVGVGAMGSALLKGLLAGGMDPEQIVVTDASNARTAEVAKSFGVKAVSGVRELSELAKYIFLAVKPQDMHTVLRDISPKDGQVLISVAAGVSIDAIEKTRDDKTAVIRIMPNTPCLIGAGAMAVSKGKTVSDKDLAVVLGWLGNLGLVEVVPENMLNAVTGLSGSGPAYIYMLIEALAEGGVLKGLPRELAQSFAVQTVLGAARMAAETDEHPAVLREKVTSPGGTTAAGLQALEKGRFRAVLINAVTAATERAKELEK